MPATAFILLVAALLPLGSFALLLFFGSRMGTPRSRAGGTALAGWVGTTAVAGSMLCSLLAMYQWYAAGGTAGAGGAAGGGYGWSRSAINLSAKWIPVGPQPNTGAASAHPRWLDVGLYVDSVTIAMFAMVSLVALLVHVFSIGYMRGDSRFPRFFAYLSLFCFAMFGLLLAGTLVQAFAFWELVGFCSYLLIGFWFEKRSAARAASKAFVVNRVGDAAFLVAFGLLFATLGNASLPHVWAALGSAGQGGPVVLGNGTVVSNGMLTAIGVCLFIGAAGKSAQFPLHTWLADAMEGPTPVSALIHAATMVAAGVYMVARMFPVLTPEAKLVIAVAGCVTLTLGALVACVQTDIKRVLAFSTVSQLGYMMLAVGVGSWAGALFHLVTHAFFKALLFLSAGSVIHAARHEQDLRQFGGLWKRIPVTACSMLVAVAAISGLGFTFWGGFGLSGWHSKGQILTDAAASATLLGGRWPAYWLLFAVPAAVAYLTAFYMARVWALTFLGRPRNLRLFDRARERPMMYVPLMGLAFMSAISGSPILNVKPLLQGAIREAGAAVTKLGYARPAADAAGHSFAGFATAWPVYSPGTEPDWEKRAEAADEALATGDAADRAAPRTQAQAAHEAGHHLEFVWVTWAWVPGALLALALYLRGFATTDGLMRLAPLRAVHAWLYRQMYFDELYAVLFVRPVVFLASLCGWFDRQVVDATVNAAANSTAALSRGVGWHDAKVVDGAAVGVGQLAWQLGSASRAPQTGRLRFYVTALLGAVVIGLAITVAIMVLR